MFRLKIPVVWLILLIPLVTGCRENQIAPTQSGALEPEPPVISTPLRATSESLPSAGDGFSIHLLNSQIPADQLDKVDTRACEGQTILSIDDVLAYWQGSHDITISSSAYKRIEHLKVPVSGLPFIICVGRQPIYTGAFWTMASSMSFDGVTILVPSTKENTIQITIGYPGEAFFSGEDPRSDGRILESLASGGKLK